MGPRLALLVATSLLTTSIASDAARAEGNYLSQINGIDDAALLPLTMGSPDSGIFRVFDSKILRAPTRVTNPLDYNGNYGSYAAKVEAIHFGVDTHPAVTTIDVPLLLVSTFPGPHTLARGATFATITSSVQGYLGAVGYPGTNILFEAEDLSFPVTAGGPSGITEITIPFDPPLTVAEGENLLIYLADARHQYNYTNEQSFLISDDENNAWESISYHLDTNGAISQMPNTVEFYLGASLVDAVTVSGNVLHGPGSSGLNSHWSLPNPFDAGIGGRTISLSGYDVALGGSFGSSAVTFATFDSTNIYGGSQRLVLASTYAVLVSDVSPGIALPGSGTGPVLSTAIPEAPRIVNSLDLVSYSLLANPFWTLATTHSTTAGGGELPWYSAATPGPAGSSGNVGGFAIPVPNIGSLVGIELSISSLALNATGTAIDKIGNSGHSHSMGYTFVFIP